MESCSVLQPQINIFTVIPSTIVTATAPRVGVGGGGCVCVCVDREMQFQRSAAEQFKRIYRRAERRKTKQLTEIQSWEKAEFSFLWAGKLEKFSLLNWLQTSRRRVLTGSWFRWPFTSGDYWFWQQRKRLKTHFSSSVFQMSTSISWENCTNVTPEIWGRWGTRGTINYRFNTFLIKKIKFCRSRGHNLLIVEILLFAQLSSFI